MTRSLQVASWWILLASAAFAHKPSDSYLSIFDKQGEISGQWEISLKDLHYILELDADLDGQITWGELNTQRDAIAAHALSRLSLSADGQRRHLAVRDLLVTKHSDGAYAALMLHVDGPGNAEAVTVHYSLLFDADPTHRGLVRFESCTATTTHVLSPDSPSVQIRIDDYSLWQTFREFVREGVWHIWIGLDHILFLLSLLFPAVLVRLDSDWRPTESFRSVWPAVLKIVTVFTIAHSITLWLAVMGYVVLPAWLVEAAIALSIIVAACNNLHPMLPLPNWAIAFGFGLVHGFGFANVLTELGLSSTTLAISLLGFNMGVELGQLAIVAVFLPIAYLLRSTYFYRRVVFQFGSVMVALVAGIWFYERLFNAQVFGV